MRHKLLLKTCQLMALMMILSTFIPVLSYAATFGISDYTYHKDTGRVTATVYTDVYNASGPDQVMLNVYGDNHTPGDSQLPWVSVGSATYATYSYNSVKAATYFSFSFNATPNVFNAVYLQGAYKGGVTNEVYVPNSTTVSPPPGSCCSIGGGGGGFGSPSSSDSTITVSADGVVNADDLANAFKTSKSVVLKLLGDFALIPAAGLLDAVKIDGAMLKVINDNGAYLLPLSIFKLDDLAKQLGIDVKVLKIKVMMAKATGDAAAAVSGNLTALGGTSLADPVDFSVMAVAPDGKTAEVNFGSTYVARQFKLNGDVDNRFSTGLVWDETAKRLSFVPSTIDKVDGTTVATLWRNSSSIYTVAKFHKSFTDVNGHWAQSYIELLANKLVVDGVSDTMFEPDRSITRAEFAALVVRSLGLKLNASSTGTFSDVKSSDWFAGVVAAASSAGLIDGYEDGTFRPDRQISREELAAMVVRAMKYTGQDTTVTDSQRAEMLAKFTDANQIVWGQRELAVAVKAGLVEGMTNTTLGSRLQATRAQSATMLERFLHRSGFIN